MVRIGILGCGRIGKVHVGSVASAEGAKVVAVADAVPAAAESLAAVAEAQVMTADEIIAAPNIDAIIIGTPTDTHFDLIHGAAAAGKAIFCEKPVDLSSDRIRSCAAAVESTGVPFMTGFNRRFDPNFAAIRERIDEGEIGAVEIVTILSRDPSPPPLAYIRSSGGIFRDMMIHDLDMARFLLGEEPDQIFAVGAALVDSEIGAAGDVDTAAVTLKTASGKICQISNSRRAAYGYDQRLEVHGSRGMLKAGNIHEDTVTFAGEKGFRSARAENFFLERYRSAYRLEIEAFINALRGGTACNPGIEDGLKAQLLADAAALSYETGAPVKL